MKKLGLFLGLLFLTSNLYASTITRSPNKVRGDFDVSGDVTVSGSISASGVSLSTAAIEEIQVSNVFFNSQEKPDHSEGRLYYNNDDYFLRFHNNESDIELPVIDGIPVFVRNESGDDITKGKAVYISGATGQKPTIELALADNRDTSRLIGMTMHTIEHNSDGYVLSQGVLNNVNTSDFTAGDLVYLSTFTAGGLTTTIPVSTNSVIMVGYILYSNASTGKMYVNPSRPIDLSNISCFDVTSPQVNDMLAYNGTCWVNRSTHVVTEIQAANNEGILFYASTATLLGTLTDVGNFGIGLSNPTDKLFVQSTQATLRETQAGSLVAWKSENTNATGKAGVKFVRTADYEWQIYGDGNANEFIIRDEQNSKSIIRIQENSAANTIFVDSDSLVGIFTATPTEALEVNGNIKSNFGVIASTAVLSESITVPEVICDTITFSSSLIQASGMVFSTDTNKSGLSALTIAEGTAEATFAGALNSPTINTGQGANELYDMDQNVLSTSDVTFNQVVASTITATDINGLYLLGYGGNGIFVKDGGFIGIQTNNPGSLLTIGNAISGNKNIRLQSGGTGADNLVFLELLRTGNYRGYIGSTNKGLVIGTGGDPIGGDDEANDECSIFIDDTTGKVGVFNSTPTANFHLIGNSSFTANAQFSSDVNCDGTITADTVRQTNIWHVYGGTETADKSVIVTASDWEQVTDTSHTLFNLKETNGFSVTLDSITVLNAGDYVGSISFTMSGTATKDYRFRCYNVTQATAHGFYASATNTGAGNYITTTMILYLENVAANDVVVFQIYGVTDGTDVTMRGIMFEIHYLHD